jgi:predicted nucleotidyltransferase
MKWVGPSLAKDFWILDQEFGPGPFTASEAHRVLHATPAQRNLRLSRLTAAGWLGRVARDRYVSFGPEWVRTGSEDPLGPFRGTPFYPELTVSIAGILHQFGRRLKSVALFGSWARGTGGPDSDVDLLVVADPLPRTLQGRVEEARPIVETVRAEARDTHPRSLQPHLPQLVLLSVEELVAEPSLLLDLTQDARILYDPEGLLERTLDRLRGKLVRLGSRRVRTPEGWQYWVLKPGARAGEVAEL